jgi:glyoxylase-like metal-dependent hydrolase (beta-lactamase superfamily II)
MQTPTTVKFNIGAIRCAILCDSTGQLTMQDVAGIFGEGAFPTFEKFGIDPAHLTFSSNILMLETDGKRVLIDAGLGFVSPDDPAYLLERLAAENIAPGSIDLIILTHFHRDHIGGLLDKDGNAAFPNARLITPKIEYHHWMSAESLANMDAGRAALLQKIFAPWQDRLTLWEGGQDSEVVPGVRLVPAPGHTPGHHAVLIASGGETLLHLVDAAHTPLQVAAPEVSPNFDFDKASAAQTRRDLIAQALAGNWRVMAYHFPSPGIGRLAAQGDHTVWTPD